MNKSYLTPIFTHKLRSDKDQDFSYVPLTYNDLNIRKFKTTSRSAFLRSLKVSSQNSPPFRAQGRFGKFVSRIRKVGSIIDSADTMVNKVNTVVEQIHTFADSLSKMDLLKGCASIIHLLVSTKSLVSAIKSDSTFDGLMAIASMALALYNVYRYMLDPLLKPVDLDTFRAQSGMVETIALTAMITALLPECLKPIFQNLPRFTSDKLLDNSPQLYSLMSYIINLPFRLAKLVGLPNEILTVLETIQYYLPFGQLSHFTTEIELISDELKANPNRIGDSALHKRVLKLNADVIEWKKTITCDFSRLPNGFIASDNLLTRLVKKVKYMMNSTRVEPLCMIFCGPRGTGKTTAMNALFKGFEKTSPVYVHATTENKDFYDMYDNEDIFVIDDIGQKGVFQWSNIINFVSTTKFPLECAQADLKLTKYFTSKLILATTNSIELTLTANSGISDLAALHRRLNVVDFSDCLFSEGLFNGNIKIKLFRSTQPTNPRSPWAWSVVETIVLANTTLLDLASRLAVYVKREVQAKIDISTKIDYSNFDFGELVAQSKIFSYNAATDEMHWFDDYMSDDDDNYSTRVAQFADRMLTRFKSNVTAPMLAGVLGVVSITMLAAGALYRALKTRTASTPTHAHSYFHPHEKRVRNLNAWRAQAPEVIPQIERFVSNTVNIQLDYLRGTETIVSKCQALMSQRLIILPFHATALTRGSIYVTISKGKNEVIYDHLSCEIVYTNEEHDLCLLRVPPTFPVLFKKVSFAAIGHSEKLFLVSNPNVYHLPSVRAADFHSSYIALNGFKGIINPTDMAYDVNYDELCGASLVNYDGMYLGMHVAGNDACGIAKIYPHSIMKILASFNEVVDSYVMPFISRDYDVPTSKIALDDPHYVNVPSATQYAPSLIHGIFPVERVPANMQPYGIDTIKVMSKKSHEATKSIDLAALAFASSYAECFVPRFKAITETDVVLGCDGVQPLNPKTSTGFGFSGERADYIDFEKGKYRPHFAARVASLRKKMSSSQFDFSTYHTETLKDELRDIEKVDKPRCFKVSPLDLLVVEKQLVANLMKNLHCNKWSNGIMVGINPFSGDWAQLLRSLTSKGDNVFDGDFGKWDGHMLSQFQQSLNQIICSKFSGDKVDSVILAQVLSTMIYTPTITLNDVYMTNHSLPTGRGLTADYNSMINKMYGAYVFYVLYKEKFSIAPTLTYYVSNVFDAVYGDDKITGVSNLCKDWFNGRTFETVCNKMGFEFTPASKGEWTYSTRSVYDCTFLKRSFRIHPSLGVVAPLDRKSMLSTLNFVSDDFRNNELTETKLGNFQREAFLHPDYISLMSHVDQYVQRVCVPFLALSDSYLRGLYKSGKYDELLVHN